MKMREIEGSKKSLLFHGTSIPNLLDIVADSKLRGDIGIDEFGPGVSFTKAVGIAWQFATQSEDYFWSNDQFPDFGQAEFDKTQPQGAVLVFNKSTLISHIDVRRVHWDGVATEREERSSGNVSLDWGLIEIRVRGDDLPTYSRAMTTHRDVFTNQQISAVTTLMRHPLLRLL